MNLFQLVLKQMRQRSLSSWLTALSVLLGVALWASVSIFLREGDSLFGQRDFGYDVLVGAKGSPLQLVVNSVYHMDRSPGNIPFDLYEQMISPRGQYRRQVKQAVPFAVGDTYQNLRIVATSPKMFGVTEDGQPMSESFQYRLGEAYQLGSGKLFHPKKLEAVIGADVPKLTGLKIGDKFFASHGTANPNQPADEHQDVQWEVVGILKSTQTAADRVLFIPLITFYCIQEHEDALHAQSAIKAGIDPSRAGQKPTTQAASKPDAHDDHDHDHDHAFTLNPDGTIEISMPKEEWQISGVFVRSRSAFDAQSLMYALNNRDEAQGVNPASVMREFFVTFLVPYAKLLRVVSFLVMVVASVSILVSIYNSISARKREIAILRALGATKPRIVTMICLEAGLIGLLGGAFGLLAGHLLVAGGSVYLRQMIGQGIDWSNLHVTELVYLGVVVAVSVIAGLVPALKAYTTPVATNLVAT